ncbi:hypothetical protein WMF04_30210 [Sorangium sp. So ce260]|uniref:hypothetical protein n=1 Tax=Sorangium sp. So ce260 TaxID=3133291 RepID=UPI003F5FEE0B
MSNAHMEEASGWKFKRNRDGDKHEKNCSDGYYRTLTIRDSTEKARGERRVAEIHHVLCVHACSDATFPSSITHEEIDFIHSSLAITDWDINGSDNNIGLPKKWAYVLDTGNTTQWDGLPCHQVDHDIYLDKVEQWITENVWNKIKANKKQKKCENMTAESVKKMFDFGSSRWKALLKARGAKHGGTKACLDYCLAGKSDPAMESVWYIPFSMAFPESDARPRVKPPAGASVARKHLLAAVR